MKIISLLIVIPLLANAQQSCGPSPSGRIQPSIASGYQVQLVATGLASPRGIALDALGNLLVVERDRGLISAHSLTEDEDSGCVSVKSSKDVTPALDLNHGIEISDDGSTLFASSVTTAFSWTYNADSLSVTDRQELVVNMDGFGHSTRTLLLSRSVPGTIVISRGSVGNLDIQAASISSGIAQVKAFNLTNLTDPYDYSEDGLLLGWGLRNEVGIAEHPISGAIYGVENSADEIYRYNVDVHEDNPAEELNLLGFLADSSSVGSNFGYPWCLSAWQVEDLPDNGNLLVGSQFAINPSEALDNENRTDAYCAEQTPPRLVFQAHTAPLDIKFNNTGRQAWITFHGSWDRSEPVGYKLSVVNFDKKGDPVEPVTSLTAANDILVNQDVSKCPAQCFRPVSLAIDRKGRIFMSSDSSGEIYLISAQSGPDKNAAASLYSSQVTRYTVTAFLLLLLLLSYYPRISGDGHLFSNPSTDNFAILHQIGSSAFHLTEPTAMPRGAFEGPTPSPHNWSDDDDSEYDDEPVVKRAPLKSSTPRKSSSTHRSQLAYHPKRRFSQVFSGQESSDESPAPKSRKVAARTARVRAAKGKPAKVKLAATTVKDVPQVRDLAPFERVPPEVRQMIASFARSDRDIVNMALASKTIAYSILPANSPIWRTRFLAKYDYPVIQSPGEFRLAYQLRRFVLDARNFVIFQDVDDKRLQIQLDVIKDLVLGLSKNLRRMASPSASQWAITFLSSPFFGFGTDKFGQQNATFEALQLTLSHLILSPKSRIARKVKTSRDNYDIARVYSYNCPLTTLYTRLAEHTPEETEFALDLNTLLHVRNFWHRHLIDANQVNTDKLDTGENSYMIMAKTLMELGHTPLAWTASLQDPLGNLEWIRNGLWHGHYTGLHPWPRDTSDLQEQQTEAEDWEHVAPLRLDFAASTDNSSSAWPWIFSSIPAFESTTPMSSDDSDTENGERPTFYLRGIAPFVDLAELERRQQSQKDKPASTLQASHRKSHSTSTSSSSSSPPPPSSDFSSSGNSLFLHHPFASLRLRGIAHPIPASITVIPGFYRVILILFRFHTQHLITVLNHAEQSSLSTSGGSHVVTPTTMPPAAQQPADTDADDNGFPLDLDPVQEENNLLAQLKAKLDTSVSIVDGKRAYAEDTMTRDRICALENLYSGGLNGQIDWADIDYAYAYEGVIVPGGRLMLGKWWRAATSSPDEIE
ncbi:hypothetical protein DV738_g4072, partial [Chaetothyriales sp. CBS 135597]